MKRLLLFGALSSCSLLVWLTDAKRCSNESPVCDGQDLVICVNGFEDRTSCEVCNEAEGRCGECGDLIRDAGEVCFVEGDSPISFGLPPKAFVVSDFNADQNQNADVLVLISDDTTNDALLFFGFGNGQFGNPQSPPMAVDDPFTLELIDFDKQDGLDVIYSNSGGNGIETFLNSSAAPSFFSQQTQTAQPTAKDLTLVDIDGDSLLDAIVAGTISNSFSVIRQVPLPERIREERANFEDGDSVDIGRFLVEASDLDKDDDPDLVFATATSIQLLQTSREPSLSFSFRGELFFSAVTALQMIDIDDDDDDDLLVVDNGGQIKLLRNVGAFDFEEELFLSVGSSVLCMIVDDVDGDGARDIILGLDDNTIEIYRNDRGSFFLAKSLSVSGPPVTARVAHIDDDGDLDLLIAHHAPPQVAPIRGLITLFLSDK